jgi:hypothetical protein
LIEIKTDVHNFFSAARLRFFGDSCSSGGQMWSSENMATMMFEIALAPRCKKWGICFFQELNVLVQLNNNKFHVILVVVVVVTVIGKRYHFRIDEAQIPKITTVCITFDFTDVYLSLVWWNGLCD